MLFAKNESKRKIGLEEASSIFGENEDTRIETIRVVLLPIGELPVAITIPKNDYDFWNSLVGGTFSTLVPDYAHKDIIMVINDVGKLQKLPPNRYLFDGKDVLCGQAFLITNDKTNHTAVSLSNEQIAYCKQAYAKFIDSTTADVLNPIIEKHAGITLQEIDTDDEECQS